MIFLGGLVVMVEALAIGQPNSLEIGRTQRHGAAGSVILRLRMLRYTIATQSGSSRSRADIRQKATGPPLVRSSGLKRTEIMGTAVPAFSFE